MTSQSVEGVFSPTDDKIPVPKLQEKDINPSSIHEGRRAITAWKLAGIGFLMTSGGPFGIEATIFAAGPLITFIGFLVLPLIYSLPQAFMTAELSSIMPENGGSVLWIDRAFGRFVGWINAYSRFFSTIFDMALYPVLFVDYLIAIMDSFSLSSSFTWWEIYLLKLGVVIFVCWLGIRGLEVVGWLSIAMTLFIFLPFILFFLLSIPAIDPKVWVQSTPQINWSLFFSTILWNLTGWDQLGALAGEVSNVRETYPRAAVLILTLNAVVFFLPLLAGLTTEPQFDQWTDGGFVKLAFREAEWLGFLVLVGGLVASAGQFLVQLSSNSHALWAMSQNGYFLRLTTATAANAETSERGEQGLYESGQGQVRSMIVLAVLTCGMVSFSFGALVQIDVFLNGVSLLLSFAALLWLRYSQPEAPRPFVLKGNRGMSLVWFLACISSVIMGWSMVTAPPLVLAATMLLMIGSVILFFAFGRSVEAETDVEMVVVNSEGSYLPHGKTNDDLPLSPV